MFILCMNVWNKYLVSCILYLNNKQFKWSNMFCTCHSEYCHTKLAGINALLLVVLVWFVGILRQPSGRNYTQNTHKCECVAQVTWTEIIQCTIIVQNLSNLKNKSLIHIFYGLFAGFASQLTSGGPGWSQMVVSI